MFFPRDRAARAAYAVGSALFIGCALLSYQRQLHIDELEALYSGQVGASFGHGDFGLPIAVYIVGFAPIARALGSSVHLFIGARCWVMGLLFVLCWALSRVQPALPSARGKACVFLSAVSCGPLWRHGFEFRHDIYLALEIALLTWAAERARIGRFSTRTALVTGFSAALAQGMTFKAFTICLPAIALCALLGARHEPSWAKASLLHLARCGLGFVLGAAVVAAIFASAGVLGEYLIQLRDFAAFSAVPPYRLARLPVLLFALERAPLQVGFVLFGLCRVAQLALKRQALGTALVPFGVLCVSLASLLPNPTVFPYNMTWLTAGCLPMCAVGMASAWELASRGWPTLSLSLVGGAAIVSFVQCERDPFYRKSWDRQLEAVAAVEALTAPDEPVLDLCGLVISRPPVGKDWLVHSLLMPAYHAGKREAVRHVIERVWPPIALVGSYRWGWLDAADIAALKHHYLRFSGDIWALGSVLDEGTHDVEIHRAGRYWARTRGDAGSIDGKPIRGGDALRLAPGSHAVRASKRFELIWIGPATPPGPASFSTPLFDPAALPGQQ